MAYIILIAFAIFLPSSMHNWRYDYYQCKSPITKFRFPQLHVNKLFLKYFFCIKKYTLLRRGSEKIILSHNGSTHTHTHLRSFKNTGLEHKGSFKSSIKWVDFVLHLPYQRKESFVLIKASTCTWVLAVPHSVLSWLQSSLCLDLSRGQWQLWCSGLECTHMFHSSFVVDIKAKHFTF